MGMLTITETAKRTGLSSYEIRRRVHSGNCPHIRVGAKATKILILFDKFIKMLEAETDGNMTTKHSVIPEDDTNTTGYGNIRRIE